MTYYESFLEIMEYTLATKQRRHVVGGLLLSMSALFCGCAITLMTINKEEK